MALVTHKDVAKVAFTGSTEIGKKIHRAIAGTDKAITLELGGKAANIVFEDAALDQAVEGIVNGIYFNQGEVCCAGSRLLVQESVADEIVDRLKTRLSTLRVGDPLDKNTDVGAINSSSQLEKITELVASGVAEGADLYQPACDLPERGYFFRPTLFTNVAQSHRVAKEEIFGPVLSVLTFRTPDEAVEKANNTAVRPVGRDLDREGVEGVRDGPGDEGGRGLGEHVQPLRPDVAVRRLQGVRVRARGRHARAPRLRPPGGPLMASRALVRPDAGGGRRRPTPGPQDLQAVPRRPVPAHGVRAVVPRERGRRRAARERLPGLAQGRPGRGAVRPWRGRRLGGADRDEPRPDPVSRRRADGGPLRPVHRRGRRRRGHPRRRRRGRRSVGRSTAGSGTPAGPTRSPRSSGRRTRSGRRTSTSRSPSRPASSGSSRPERSSLLGLVSRLGPVLAGGNVAVVLASEARPLPAITLAEVLATSDVPGGVVNILTGYRKELVPVLAAHVDVDGLDGFGIPDDLRVAAEVAAADSVKRMARRPRGTTDARFDWLDDRAAERPEWIAAFLEMKTVWHPIGV